MPLEAVLLPTLTLEGAMMRTPLIVLCSLVLVLFVGGAGGAPSASAAVTGDAVDNLDNYFVPYFPEFYGEILNYFTDEQLKHYTPVMDGVLIFSVLKGLADMATKLESGDNMGAAIDGITAGLAVAIKCMADEATKKIVIYGTGVSTFPLGLAVATIGVAKKSCDAVAASQIALDIERLKHSVVSDVALKNRGRKLGEGEPIRIDKETVEYLWRKILMDPVWAGLFKSYVVRDLHETWPSPSYWDKLTVPSDFLREDALIKEEQRLKLYVAGLLSELNKLAKREEQRVILTQHLRNITRHVGKVDKKQLAKAAKDYSYALKKLPEVEAFAEKLPEEAAILRHRIKTGKADEVVTIRTTEIWKKLYWVEWHMKTLQKIPVKGRHAATRKALLDALKSGYLTLYAMRSMASDEEVMARLRKEWSSFEGELNNLEADARAMARVDTPFVITRHEPGITYEVDLAPLFADDALKGGGRFRASADKARGLVAQKKEALTGAYKKDVQDQEAIYKKEHGELSAELSGVRERIHRERDEGKREKLKTLLNRLTALETGHRRRFEIYTQQVTALRKLDTGACEDMAARIDAFVKAYTERYAGASQSLEALFETAEVRLANHPMLQSGKTRRLFSSEKLDELEAVLRENKAAYLGLDLGFLKELVSTDPERTPSANLNETLTSQSRKLKTYISALYGMRLTYFDSWNRSVLPSLAYMAGGDAAADIDDVIGGVDRALAEYFRFPKSTIAPDRKALYQQRAAALELSKQRLLEEKRLVQRGGALYPRFESYCLKAQRVNARIEMDAIALFALQRQFDLARQNVSRKVGRFIIKGAEWSRHRSGEAPILTSADLHKALASTGVLGYSDRHGLGMRELIPEGAIEMYTPSGPRVFTVGVFKALSEKIKDLPTGDYTAYAKAVNTLRQAPGGTGTLMTLAWSMGLDFPDLFPSDPTLHQLAEAIAKNLADVGHTVDRNQRESEDLDAPLNEMAARLSGARLKIEEAIKGAEGLGEEDRTMETATIYATWWPWVDQQHAIYETLTKKRADVEHALASLKKALVAIRPEVVDTPVEEGVAEETWQSVREFYARFARAYESKNESRVMALLDDEWEAGDGTTLLDLEENLYRIYSLFDEITYKVDSLVMEKSGDGLTVTYNATITSQIYSRGMTHTETSRVTDLLTPTGNGFKIIRTPAGTYWGN